MCIYKVSPVKPKSSGRGYKVYNVQSDGLRSAYIGDLNPWQTWITARNAFSSGAFDTSVGFHIYVDRRKAEQCVRWYNNLHKCDKPQNRPNYQIFRVKYRQAISQGIGDGGYTENARVILAQEIYIL